MLSVELSSTTRVIKAINSSVEALRPLNYIFLSSVGVKASRASLAVVSVGVMPPLHSIGNTTGGDAGKLFQATSSVTHRSLLFKAAGGL